MEKKIVINNWHPSSPVIYNNELGWSEDDYLDAESRDPEEVFNYYWRHCFSIVFYNISDGNFYELFMEGHPFKFWRIPRKENWDGKWICDMINWNSHEEGEVLFEFDDDTDLLNKLKLNGVPIVDVISNSVIAEINI